MKILITGAGGWLGAELTERLLEEGNDIKAFVLFSSEKLKVLKDKYRDNLEIIEGDICNREVVNNSLKDIEVVYHLAAKVHSLPKSKSDEDAFFKINTYATEQLFELCLENNIKRVIFYSSVSVYGESDNLIDINTKKEPVTAYAKSKFLAEEAGLKLYKEKCLPITIIQPVTVYGGQDVGNFEKLKSLVSKGVIPRFGDGTNKKTIIYYKDLITMTIKIAKDESSIGKVIICGTENVTYNHIINSLMASCNNKVTVVKINRFLTNMAINTLDFIGIGPAKNIGRQLRVLSSNNEYDLKGCNKYISDIMKFESYYK